MKTYDSLCACGHPQSAHAGRTHLGVCATCHGASGHGQRAYCKRYRIVIPTPTRASRIALSIMKVRIEMPPGATDTQCDAAIEAIESMHLVEQVREFVLTQLDEVDGLDGFGVTADYDYKL